MVCYLAHLIHGTSMPCLLDAGGFDVILSSGGVRAVFDGARGGPGITSLLEGAADTLYCGIINAPTRYCCCCCRCCCCCCCCCCYLIRAGSAPPHPPLYLRDIAALILVYMFVFRLFTVFQNVVHINNNRCCCRLIASQVMAWHGMS